LATNIALVLKGYPRLSETFIAQEIRQLELRGKQITLVSLRHPTDKSTHPIHDEIEADVIYLPEYLHDEPLRVLKGWLHSRKQPGYRQMIRQWWRDFRRDMSRNRIRRLGQAFVLSRELPEGTEQLYAHFLHTPASVTRYTAGMTQLPWSASAHAKDIWTSEQWDLSEKLTELQWLATCTGANYEYLQSLAAEPDKVNLVYHGLDFSRFDTPESLAYSEANGEQPEQPVKLISVGRAVPKKGYDDLITALATLPKELNWQFTHIGGGSILEELQQQAAEAGIADRIIWRGALPQKEVLDEYRKADLFVLPSKIIGDGDRDGLPNVLMEAQSQGLCCLSTSISGIPELIDDQQTGVLVEQKQPSQLAQALELLIRQPELRQQYGHAGFVKVREKFDVARGIDQLIDLFE